jgi:hypothetical protein
VNELHKIAFEYRNSDTLYAHEAWQELEQYVKQLINEEREACVNAVSHALYGQNGCGKAIDAIRARGQE